MIPISRPAQRTRVAPPTAEEETGLLPALLASSPDGIAFIDRDLTIRAANESLAGQVVSNLLDNAIKFSPAGTRIDVDLSLPTPETVRLTVRDYGPGVAPERRARLFSRFYQAQTGRPFAGLGLGLYYSRQIAEAHGGQVEAQFPPDGGTRLIVTLPRAAEFTRPEDEGP